MSLAEKKSDRVNVRDDAQMVALGLRNPDLTPRDPSVWSKTPYERRILKKMRHSAKLDGFHTPPKPSGLVHGKLIIYLKKNKKYSKTTISTECWDHEVPYVVSRYYTTKKVGKDTMIKESLVTKYVWEGKTYKM